MGFLDSILGKKPEDNSAVQVSDSAAEVKVKDPACGMEIDKDKAVVGVDHEGKTHHFCSTTCKNDFLGDGNETNSKPQQKPEGGCC